MPFKVNRPILKTIFIFISKDENLNRKKKAFLREYKTLNNINYAGSNDPKQVLSIYYPKEEMIKELRLLIYTAGRMSLEG